MEKNLFIGFIGFAVFTGLVLIHISFRSYIQHNTISVLSTRSPDSSNNRVLYYLSTQEGIIAHLRYIQVISYLAKYYNRSVILAPFLSIHYPDVSTVNLCEYFDFPSHISCTNESALHLLTSKKCIYTGYSRYNNDSGIPRYINITRTNDFSFESVECIAGQVLYTSGHFPRDHITHDHITRQGYFHIKPKYKYIFQFAKLALLGSHNDSHAPVYAVTHWRRGDQLDNRCKVINSLSINCGSADDMILELTTRLRYFAKSNYTDDMLKYVATNENNHETLAYLQTRGLKIYDDVESNTDSMRLKQLNSIERFLVDLMFMCDATYYVSWGHTLVFYYVDYCREYKVF